MRALRLLVVATGAMALTACAPFGGFACTTIGHTSTVSVGLAEPRVGVTLEMCGGDGCEPGPVMSGEAAPLEWATATDLAIPTPAPSSAEEAHAEMAFLAGNGRSGWNVAFLTTPAVLGYRLTDADGTVIAEGEVETEWTRVDGSAECGGSMVADVELVF